MIRYLAPLLLLTATSAHAQSTPPILVDQFGYVPQLQKRAIIKDPQVGYDAALSFAPGKTYAVIDTRSGKTVYSGAPSRWKNGQTDEPSGDRLWWFDFSSVTTPGEYVVRDVDRRVDSYRFRIADDVYTPVLKAAFRTFYLQRAGFEKRAPYAPRGYADKASHLGRLQDPQTRLFSVPDDPGKERDLRGGWYDAGDYNKYTNWTANYVTWLLAAYLENPKVWTDDFGIPESGNGIPDILDEVKWGLDWLERMQNADGAMLSVQSLAEGSPPSKADGPSLYGPPNTSATITSAGAFAMAAKVFAEQNRLKLHAERYAGRADKAWRWAEANPKVKFFNNDARDNSEGLAAGQQEVEADRFAKKSLISAVHMHALTGDAYFADITRKLYARVKPMDPATPNGFEGNLAFEMLYHARQPNTDRKFADQIRRSYDRDVLNGYNGWPAIASGEDGYGAYTDGYWWGSNSTKARRGEVFTQAVVHNIGSQNPRDYLNAGLSYVNYIHGVNPNAKVYLSNMSAYGAENSVDQFYHAWFKDGSKLYDSVRESKYGPAPGFLVGGPNDSYARDECCADTCGGYGAKMCKIPVKSPPSGQPPAKSYADFNEGWPINSWSVTENSNSYQIVYLRLLSKYAK